MVVRKLVRTKARRDPQPSAARYDSRTLRSTPESGERAGYDGQQKTNGSKLHLSTDTPGNPLALEVSPADEQDRAHIDELSETTEIATENSVEKVFVDQGYTGERAAEAAEKHGIELEVVKVEGVKGGFVLLPRRWVNERTNAWAARFRRLSRDFERLEEDRVTSGSGAATFCETPQPDTGAPLPGPLNGDRAHRLDAHRQSTISSTRG